MTRRNVPPAIASAATLHARWATSLSCSRLVESHVNPSPSECHSTPSCRPIFSSPTFHSPLFTNCKTTTGQPIATDRSITPNAALLLPLPSPALTSTNELTRAKPSGRGSSASGVSVIGSRRLEPTVAAEDPLGLRRTPFTAEIRVHRPGGVERRLHDPPRLLDHVLSGEAARLPGHRIVEQAFVRLSSLAERGREVDGHIDVLAVEVRPGSLGLQCEGDTILRSQAEAHEVAAGRRPTGLVEQHARRLAELDDDFGCCLFHGLATPHVPRHAGPPP